MPNKKTDSAVNKKASNKLLSALLLSVTVCFGVTLACFSYLAFIERPSISQSSVTAQAKSLANSQASLLDQALNQLSIRLTKIAASEELLIAVDQQDQLTIDRYKTELGRAFPEALSNKLVVCVL